MKMWHYFELVQFNQTLNKVRARLPSDVLSHRRFSASRLFFSCWLSLWVQNWRHTWSFTRTTRTSLILLVSSIMLYSTHLECTMQVFYEIFGAEFLINQISLAQDKLKHIHISSCSRNSAPELYPWHDPGMCARQQRVFFSLLRA